MSSRLPSRATAARWSACRGCRSPSSRCGWRCRCWPSGSSPGGALGAEAIATRAAFDAHEAGELRTSRRSPTCPDSRAPSRELRRAADGRRRCRRARGASTSAGTWPRLLSRAEAEARRAGAVSRAARLALRRRGRAAQALPAAACCCSMCSDDGGRTHAPRGGRRHHGDVGARPAARAGSDGTPPATATATSRRIEVCGSERLRRVDRRRATARRLERPAALHGCAVRGTPRRKARLDDPATCLSRRRRRPRGGRDRRRVLRRGRARRAVRRDGGAAARAADLPRPARARVLARRDPGVVRARHAPARSAGPRLPGAAGVRRRRPVGAPLRRVSVARPGARVAGRRRAAGSRWHGADADGGPADDALVPRRPPTARRGPGAARRGARRRRARRATAWSPARCARRGAGRSCWSRPRSSRASTAGSGGCPACATSTSVACASWPRRTRLAAPRAPCDRDCEQLQHLEDVRAADRRRRSTAGATAQLWASGSTAARGAGAARAAPAGARAARARRAGAARQRRSGRAAARCATCWRRGCCTLTHEPPRRRHGRVFVGTLPRGARPHRSAWSSCPAWPSASSRSGCARTRCCSTRAAPQLDARPGDRRHARRRRAAAAAPGGRRGHRARCTSSYPRARAARVARRACRRSTCSTSMRATTGAHPALHRRSPTRPIANGARVAGLAGAADARRTPSTTSSTTRDAAAAAARAATPSATVPRAAPATCSSSTRRCAARSPSAGRAGSRAGPRPTASSASSP